MPVEAVISTNCGTRKALVEAAIVEAGIVEAVAAAF
jgi:hypothetical protein